MVLESVGMFGTAINRRVLMLAGISNSWLRMFDLMERMRNNLEKDHSLVRRFTGGVVHQVILFLQASTPGCHAVSTAAEVKHRVMSQSFAKDSEVVLPQFWGMGAQHWKCTSPAMNLVNHAAACLGAAALFS